MATILGFAIGSLLGVFGAWRRGGFADSVLPPILLFVGSFPYFWLASLALFFLGFRWNLFPLRHAYADDMVPNWSWEFPAASAYHLILPAGTILLVSIGGWMLGMRNTMIAVLAEDYITMAEAKGLPQSRIMFAYAARNALLPNVTAFGMALGFVISGALVTETVFAYPGLGYQLLTAVRNLDYPLMQGIFLMITFAVLAANLLVDVLYVRLDPRVRAGRKGSRGQSLRRRQRCTYRSQTSGSGAICQSNSQEQDRDPRDRGDRYRAGAAAAGAAAARPHRCPVWMPAAAAQPQGRGRPAHPRSSLPSSPCWRR